MIEMPTCNTFTNNWKMKQLANVLVACSNIATYMAIHQYVLQHPNACFFSSYVFICSSMFVLQFPSFLGHLVQCTRNTMTFWIEYRPRLGVLGAIVMFKGMNN